MKKQILTTALILLASLAQAETPMNEWRKGAAFSDPEANFKQAIERLEKEYVDQHVTKQELYRAATAGLLEALNPKGEHYDELLTPEDLRLLDGDLSSKIVGIGTALRFEPESGNATVIGVIPHSPAEAAGVLVGDLILSIDGQRFKGKLLADMVQLIRGKSGESVKLKVLRGDELKTISIKRAEIPLEITTLEQHDDYGYLRIGYFNNVVVEETANQLKQFAKSGKKQLIVDLRGNTGGLFDKAVETAELFSVNEAVVARTKDRSGHVESYKSAKGLLAEDVKLIVLINADTMSGAELVAGALKDLRHAKLVGEKTHGKWSVQTIQRLPNHFALKYTVQSFESPSGRNYEGVGIAPDFVIALDPKEEATLATMKPFAKRLELDPQLRAAGELFRQKN